MRREVCAEEPLCISIGTALGFELKHGRKPVTLSRRAIRVGLSADIVAPTSLFRLNSVLGPGPVVTQSGTREPDDSTSLGTSHGNPTKTGPPDPAFIKFEAMIFGRLL